MFVSGFRLFAVGWSKDVGHEADQPVLGSVSTGCFCGNLTNFFFCSFQGNSSSSFTGGGGGSGRGGRGGSGGGGGGADGKVPAAGYHHPASGGNIGRLAFFVYRSIFVAIFFLFVFAYFFALKWI